MRIVIVLSVFFGASMAANVGDSCTANSQCSTVNSFCKVLSPSCNSGTCSCISGFALDNTDGSCKTAAGLDTKCDANTLCTAENSVCTSGACKCATGYQKGLKGNDCVSTLKTERYNGKCYDSVQCYYNMVCLNNQCTCYTGYKVVGDYACQERSVGDACSSDDDCSRTPNTACSGGKCQCASGYKQVEYQTSSTSSSKACVASTDSNVNEGGTCNTTISSSGNQLCNKPYVCTSCTSSKQICGIPPTQFSGADSVISAATTTLFLVVSSIVLTQRV